MRILPPLCIRDGSRTDDRYLQYVNVDNSQLPPSSIGTGRSPNNILGSSTAIFRRLSQRVLGHGRTAAASGSVTGADVTPVPTALLTTMLEDDTIGQ